MLKPSNPSLKRFYVEWDIILLLQNHLLLADLFTKFFPVKYLLYEILVDCFGKVFPQSIPATFYVELSYIYLRNYLDVYYLDILLF